MKISHSLLSSSLAVIVAGILFTMAGSAFAQNNGKGKKPKDPPSDPNPAILFTSGGSIYAMDADGSNPTLVIGDTGQGSYANPEWSPDGTQIVFNGNIPPYGYGIYIVNSDGSDLTFLTPADSLGCLSWSPVPTADGSYKILFDDLIDGGVWVQGDIFAINPDGTGRVNLTNTPDLDEWHGVSWSPQADAFACAGNVLAEGPDECFVFDVELVDGELGITNVASISNVPGSELQSAYVIDAPDWSNAGDLIAIKVDDGQLWVIDRQNPAEPQHLTAGVNWKGRKPVWSPDDSLMAIQRYGPGKDGIAVMSATGSDPHLIGGWGYPSDWR